MIKTKNYHMLIFRSKKFLWMRNVSKNFPQMVLNKKNMLKFNEYFVKNCDEDSYEGYILKVDVKYPKNMHYLHSGLPLLPERMKINKCNSLVCNMYDKN